jgi:hypothetical protein
MNRARDFRDTVLPFALALCFLGTHAAAAAGQLSPGTATRSLVTYAVDCSAVAKGDGSLQRPLHTLAEANALLLKPGDRLLFKRASTCKGQLQPHGSGSESAPISIGAYGAGPLPRIEANPGDEFALRLFNQSFWEISSLDLKGGTTYGLFAGGDAPVLHHIHLRNLRVHDVRGLMKRKESGLVVINASGTGIGFDDIEVDGILASNTTQWSGIFVSGASHVRIRNSIAHDMQGDGIVVFESRDAIISRSLAWHTGMQHQLTIGTPNAIWTWHCSDCTVEDNEAFLADSPGVDGGAFDIDFGNTRNTVQRNFGHDTVGYCVAVFGAFGPTTDSVVADNVCLNNGTSPRLAQRQGALLLMTWQGGSLNGVDLRGNRIDWQPPGNTPAVQSGGDLHAAGVTLHANEIWSSASSFVNPKLKYSGVRDRYIAYDLPAAQTAFAALPETDSTLAAAPAGAVRSGAFGIAPSGTGGWQLVVAVPANTFRNDGGNDLRGTFVAFKSAALQYGHAGLEVKLVSDDGAAEMANDWQLAEGGVMLDLKAVNQVQAFSVKLISPQGEIKRHWDAYPSPVELGLALRQNVGLPDFSHLEFENVRARD